MVKYRRHQITKVTSSFSKQSASTDLVIFVDLRSFRAYEVSTCLSLNGIGKEKWEDGQLILTEVESYGSFPVLIAKQFNPMPTEFGIPGVQ